jgi:hypothetical protein
MATIATPITALAAAQVRNLEKSSPTKLFNFYPDGKSPS